MELEHLTLASGPARRPANVPRSGAGATPADERAATAVNSYPGRMTAHFHDAFGGEAGASAIRALDKARRQPLHASFHSSIMVG